MTASPRALDRLRAGRAHELFDLGPRPQGFSPFARMRWDRKRRAIGQRYYEAARNVAINEGMLTPGYERALREGWL